MHKTVARKAFHQGGITLQLHSNSIADATEVAGDYWYYPVLPDNTVIVSEHDLPTAIAAFVTTNAPELQRPNRYLGVWCNPTNSQYYIDINERSPAKTHAIERVKQINAQSKRQILSIYNSSCDTSLSL
ncbi:hypothetical protein EOL96_03570 [Candidatus Saccharibacteria bacterium]|nr:hypothetical protein [Candidatus Saccharibacteria bacterium]